MHTNPIAPSARPFSPTARWQASRTAFLRQRRLSFPPNGIITNPDPNQVYFQINPHFREPYVESWNLAIQRSLPFNFVFDIAYVGNHGVDQPSNYNLNASTT